jgi:5-methyltetrahydropteroyltriglutamate--homocysteine methyltransferase
MSKTGPITIPTEPIGSIPRPVDLIERVAMSDSEDPKLAPLYEDAIRDTIERFEATGSPVVTDGEQKKYHNFWTYCVHGLPNTAPDGFIIPFSDGHMRRMSRLTRGPFRYRRYADCYLDAAMRYAHVPVKQAVISPSALSLMYPAEDIRDYSREANECWHADVCKRRGKNELATTKPVHCRRDFGVILAPKMGRSPFGLRG